MTDLRSLDYADSHVTRATPVLERLGVKPGRPGTWALIGFVAGMVTMGALFPWSRDAVIEAQKVTIKDQQATIEKQGVSVAMAGQLLDTVFPGFHGRPLPTCVVDSKARRAKR